MRRRRARHASEAARSHNCLATDVAAEERDLEAAMALLDYSMEWARTSAAECRQALRGVVRSGTALVSIGTMSFGTAAVAMTYTFVSGVLLDPLPYPTSERLVRVSEVAGASSPFKDASFADFEDIVRESTVFEVLAAYSTSATHHIMPAGQHVALLKAVTSNSFALLGAKPVLGRDFLSEDSELSRERVAVLSFGFWQRHFEGRGDILGEKLHLPFVVGGRDLGPTLTVIGVMPAEFEVPFDSSRFGVPTGSTGDIVWTAVRPDARQLVRSRRDLTVLGRLREGASLNAANAELAAISTRLSAMYPASNGDVIAVAAPVLTEIVGETGAMLWPLLAGAILVFFIGTANVSSLQIARSMERKRDFAIRKALGCGSLGLIKVPLIEALIISAISGGGGIWLAHIGTSLVLTVVSPDFPRRDRIVLGLDETLLMMAVSLALGAVLGLAWSLRARTVSCQPGVPGRSYADARRPWQYLALIAGQTALVAVLMIAATSLAYSLWLTSRRDIGIDEENLWIARISLPDRYTPQRDLAHEFWSALLVAVRSDQAVRDAALVAGAGGPLGRGDFVTSGISSDNGKVAQESFSMRTVTEDYFRTLGVAVDGREFSREDVASDLPIAVINKKAAKILYGAEHVTGRFFSDGEASKVVIGVVDDFKHVGLQGEVAPQIYWPARRTRTAPGGLGPFGTAIIRSRDSGTVRAKVVSMSKALEPDVSVEVASPRELRRTLVQDERERATIALLLAAWGGLLGIVGVSGVVAYAVVVRRHEIGVRLALGARRWSIVWLLTRQTITAVVLGLVAGSIASTWVSEYVAGMLYDTTMSSPPVLAMAWSLLLIPGAAAGGLQALRAVQIDPATALRID